MSWEAATQLMSSEEDKHNRYFSSHNYHKLVSFLDTTHFTFIISTPLLSQTPSIHSSSTHTLIFLFLQLKHPCLDFLCPFLDFCTTSSSSDSCECSLLFVSPFLELPDFSDSAFRFLTITSPESLVESEKLRGECCSTWLVEPEEDPEVWKRKSTSAGLSRSMKGSLSQSELIGEMD